MSPAFFPRRPRARPLPAVLHGVAALLTLLPRSTLATDGLPPMLCAQALDHNQPWFSASCTCQHALLLLALWLLTCYVCLLLWLQAREALLQASLLQGELNRMEQLLEQYLQSGARESRRQLRLLQEASHDMRTRLHAVQLLAWHLQRDLPQQYHASMQRLLKALASLQHFARQFLQFSRLQQGLPTQQKQRLHLQDVFQALELEFEQMAESHGVQLQVRACNLWLHNDVETLQRVLENLLSNALKFARHRVLLAARRRQQQVWIEVRDDGPGIAPEEQEAVFEAFVHQREGNPDGVGLGLAIVRRLLPALDAELQLISHPGRGTLFRLMLPASTTDSG